MRSVVVVVDLQYGSTGKGQIAGSLGRLWHPDTVVCANGPNAGHTYRWTGADHEPYSSKEFKIVHTVMPVGAVLPSVRNILLGPGAVIDIEKLASELCTYPDLFSGKRLIIHPNASIVTHEHRDAEKALVSVGSTMKGTAEAVISKMRRRDYSIACDWSMGLIGLRPSVPNFTVAVAEDEYVGALDSSTRLLVEGAQGASLSMHSRFYPHTTSRDVSLAQIWADCRLPAVVQNNAIDINVVGVARTYPIRVANRYNEAGVQIGHSGGCYRDQEEISWADIGRRPELTTVTKLPRRLFTFSTEQILESVRYNSPTSLALTFCDYLPGYNAQHPDTIAHANTYPIDFGLDASPDLKSLARRLENAASCNLDFVSFGPNDTDLYGYDSGLLSRLQLPWV